jgi:hypothetical protein
MQLSIRSSWTKCHVTAACNPAGLQLHALKKLPGSANPTKIVMVGGT